MNRFYLQILLACFGNCVYLNAAEPDFNTHVLPIFRKYCAACHNEKEAEGKLVLSSYEATMKGGEHGAAITPRRSESSRLVRLLTRSAKPFMPPDDSEAPREAEIATIRNWIDAGAKGPSGKAPDATVLVTPKIQPRVAAKGSITALASSPCNQQLAIARGNVVEVTDGLHGKVIYRLTDHIGQVQSLAFSSDGAWLLVASGETGLFGEAKLWNLDDGSLLKTFRGHQDTLLTAKLSPDGKLLATGSYDHTIILWDVATGKALHMLEGHNGAIYSLDFHPRGHLLASASGDRTVKLWSIPAGKRLDTLKESTKELYAVAFHPAGEQLAAGGVDNRIRIWKIHPEGRENESPLLASNFAHEQALLRLAYSADGRFLVSTGEDSFVKVWNANDYSARNLSPQQADWPTALTVSYDNKQAIFGRWDGKLETLPLEVGPQTSNADLQQLAEVPPEVDYGPQPAIEKLTKTNEVEPNDLPAQATPLNIPGIGVGRIHSEAGQRQDVDLYKFAAKKDDQWIIETNAARSKSPLDSKIEVLTITGQPQPRLLLRAVRSTQTEFRGASSDQRGFRLENWEEMSLNDYVYLNGDVIKLFQQRRGPDAEAQFYPENGNRFAFFDTTPQVHGLGEPGYMVVPYPLGTILPNNGLPVFTLNYENDDDSRRTLGKDSRFTFVAPHDGEFLVRVSDVRRFAGPDYKYELIVRRPQPAYKVTLNGANPTLPIGSGKAFTVKAERIDNFNGPIRIDITNVPPGFQATTPLIIEASLHEAQGVLSALPTLKLAENPAEDVWKQVKICATAMIAGREVKTDVNNFGTVKLAEKPKVILHLELLDASREASDPAKFRDIPEITIVPGERTKCRLRVERNGFEDRLQMDVENLPLGVIVDDIGLSGVLIREKETERTVFLRCEPWVKEQSREFIAKTKEEGNQTSLPMRLHVKTIAPKKN